MKQPPFLLHTNKKNPCIISALGRVRYMTSSMERFSQERGREQNGEFLASDTIVLFDRCTSGFCRPPRTVRPSCEDPWQDAQILYKTKLHFQVNIGGTGVRAGILQRSPAVTQGWCTQAAANGNDPNPRGYNTVLIWNVRSLNPAPEPEKTSVIIPVSAFYLSTVVPLYAKIWNVSGKCWTQRVKVTSFGRSSMVPERLSPMTVIRVFN